MHVMSKLGLTLVPGLLLATACSSTDERGDVDCESDTCDTGDIVDATPIKLCESAADFKTTNGSLKCTPCGDVFADRSGRGFIPAFIADDAFVQKVFMTFEDKNKNKKIDEDEVDCPIDMIGIMAKLEKTDEPDCTGVDTRIVSETASPLRRDQANYRAVTARQCNGRPKHGLLFSTFGYSGLEQDLDADGDGSVTKQDKEIGLHITHKGAPGEVEIIAFDETEGVFNFYKEVGGQMRFFGSSLDYVVAGPGGPSLTSTRGCANCHPGGGINMKELQAPWVHWSLTDDLDGADVLVQSRPYLGMLNSGVDMEQIVEGGNRAWNATKAKFFATTTTAAIEKAKTGLKDDQMSAAAKADIARRQLKRKLNATQLLLQPLFCAVQVNIQSPGASVPGQVFMTNRSNSLFFSGFISVSDQEFDDALKAIDSRVFPDLAKPRDTAFVATAIETSHEDADYVGQLIEANVIDQQFADDVMMVDFTRSVFSDDRCSLLDLIPDVPPASRKGAKLKQAILTAVKNSKPKAGSAAAQFQKQLEATAAKKPIDYQAIVQKYTDACVGRPPTEMLRDGLKLRSLLRKLAFGGDGEADGADGTGNHPYLVFEFEETMAADQVKITANAEPDAVDEISLGSRLSPEDCKLVNEFVAPK